MCLPEMIIRRDGVSVLMLGKDEEGASASSSSFGYRCLVVNLPALDIVKYIAIDIIQFGFKESA